jgi:CspA family cold shock protein
MPRGTVKWFNSDKGYGFIAQDGGTDLFVHVSAIGATGFGRLDDGQEVEFEVGTGQQSLQAVHVRAA